MRWDCVRNVGCSYDALPCPPDRNGVLNHNLHYDLVVKPLYGAPSVVISTIAVGHISIHDVWPTYGLLDGPFLAVHFRVIRQDMVEPDSFREYDLVLFSIAKEPVRPRGAQILPTCQQ